MVPTNENAAWMIGKITEFQHYPGYPTEDAALISTAKRILAIVYNKPMLRGLPAPDGTPVDQLQVANDVDWLMEWIGRDCDRFPLPKQIRVHYQKKFKPADGYETPTAAPGEE